MHTLKIILWRWSLYQTLVYYRNDYSPTVIANPLFDTKELHFYHRMFPINVWYEMFSIKLRKISRTRLSNRFSWLCLVPWINNLPQAWWPTIRCMILNDSWCVSIVSNQIRCIGIPQNVVSILSYHSYLNMITSHDQYCVPSFIY